MAEAKRDEVPLPEPHGYVGACNQYCIQPKDSPLMWEKLNRWTADQLREYGRQCVQAERERCARVVEQFPHWLGNQGRAEIAAAIRSQNLIKE